MTNLIVTHPGKAHFDEFLAISLILAARRDENFAIERRKPTGAELEDPDVWVIDIGDRHEPELKNFDHHQDLGLPVSFVLVADYLGLTEKLSGTPWWSFKDKIDRFGPVNMAREMGVETVVPMYSPFEAWFLTLFEKSPLMVQHMMLLFATSIIEEADKLAECLTFWREAEKIMLKGKKVMIGLTDDSTGAQHYCDITDDPPDLSLTFDNRGEGWKFFRFNQCTGVNFSLLENHEEIFFAHKGGFIAKTKRRLPMAEALELMAGAIEE